MLLGPFYYFFLCTPWSLYLFLLMLCTCNSFWKIACPLCTTLLVCRIFLSISGCQNRTIIDWVAKTTEIYFLIILKAQDQCSNVIGFWWELSSWLVNLWFLAVSLQGGDGGGVLEGSIERGREQTSSLVSYDKSTNLIMRPILFYSFYFID